MRQGVVCLGISEQWLVLKSPPARAIAPQVGATYLVQWVAHSPTRPVVFRPGLEIALSVEQGLHYTSRSVADLSALRAVRRTLPFAWAPLVSLRRRPRRLLRGTRNECSA